MPIATMDTSNDSAERIMDLVMNTLQANQIAVNPNNSKKIIRSMFITIIKYLPKEY